MRIQESQVESSNPRFEFRSFGQHFDNAAKRMARLSNAVPEALWERSSDEVYIVSQANDINNTKIRDDKMDIKTLVQTIDGLEQWSPLMKGKFPMDDDVLKNVVFPAFQVSIPGLTMDIYSYTDFVELVAQHPQLQAVHIHKQRFGYMVNETICETGIILVNGARVFTISSESTNIDDVKKTIRDLGLEETENINYIQMIKRVIGMIDKPLAN